MRCVRLLAHFKNGLPLAVCASYLRDLWNGWPTRARMRTMKVAGPIQSCLFGCSTRAKDRIEHYAKCPTVWHSMIVQPRNGPGFSIEQKASKRSLASGRASQSNDRRWSPRRFTLLRKSYIQESGLVQALRIEWNKNR